MYRTVLCCLAVLVPAVPVPAQVQLPDWDEVEIVTHDLGRGLYMLEGFGGNIAVSVGEDGVFLVDDQYAPLTDKILAAIGRLTDRPVQFVLNTHWHPDHTNGNERLGARGAVIAAHDNTYRHLVEAQTMEALDEMLRPSPAGLPILTFSDTATFRINGETIRAVHIPPAHTDGDVIVHFREADVIHVGDAYFNGFYPFIDVANGGSIDGMIDFLGLLTAIADEHTRILPGHGPIASVEDVRRYRADLMNIRDRVAAAIAEGVTLDELVSHAPLADLDPLYAGDVVGQADVLRMVYESLIRAAGAAQ